MSEEQLPLEKRKFTAHLEYYSKHGYIKNMEQYQAMYKESIENPDKFWAEAAEEFVEWFKKWDKVQEHDFPNAKIQWFIGGKLNVAYNCLDRHIKTWRKNKAAIIWEGDSPNESRTLTYLDLYNEVCKFANVLRKLGVKKGDRVTIYLPMIPELPIAMLACARIGAIHSVVFGGFSAESLRDRIKDCKAKLLVVSDGSFRGQKITPLKENADEALKECPTVEKVIVVKRTNNEINMVDGRDFWYHEEMNAPDIKPVCEPEWMDAEDPLFILYTSGSTGKPKGVLHTTGGYLVYVAMTTKYIFDIKEEETFWCTADIGWVTGHSYIVYGPLCNGFTSVQFEGVPSYPAYDRFWAIVEKYKVDKFYTAPTAIRAIARQGDKYATMHDVSSLKLLGSVGEPLNPEAWLWYYKTIGREWCPIVDTWWQTETGGALITPLPCMPIKAGSVAYPFFGVQPVILDVDTGKEITTPNQEGALCLKAPWPGLMRTVFGDPERFKDTYFTQFPGYYFSGDGAKRDEDGYFWIFGRIDDVINVSGHRLGSAEIESALVAHEKVAEAAVVGYPHKIKGQSIYAFVTLNAGVEKSDELKKELVQWVRSQIGPIATPEIIQFADGLPKTRSGKIMRRILKKIAAGDVKTLGDTSTLADPSVIDDLIANRIPTEG